MRDPWQVPYQDRIQHGQCKRQGFHYTPHARPTAKDPTINKRLTIHFFPNPQKNLTKKSSNSQFSVTWAKSADRIRRLVTI
jgi:hypothetical protein